MMAIAIVAKHIIAIRRAFTTCTSLAEKYYNSPRLANDPWARIGVCAVADARERHCQPEQDYGDKQIGRIPMLGLPGSIEIPGSIQMVTR